jgi:hypothetical protein
LVFLRIEAMRVHQHLFRAEAAPTIYLTDLIATTMWVSNSVPSVIRVIGHFVGKFEATF